MNRRALLTVSGTAFVAPFAGCLSASNGNATTNASENGNNEENSQEEDHIKEDPRVDVPPYEINSPKVEDDGDFDPNDWNEDYLGEHMKQEPSRSFDVLIRRSSSKTILEDELNSSVAILEDGLESGGAYQAKLVASKTEYEEIFNGEEMDEEVQKQLTAVDFDESVLVVVESGWGTSSTRHQWARVMDIEEGLHLYGYYIRPYEVTSDFAPRLSVLEVERPSNPLELARVSLTVSEDSRVHINSIEGVVTLTEENKSEQTP